MSYHDVVAKSVVPITSTYLNPIRRKWCRVIVARETRTTLNIVSRNGHWICLFGFLPFWLILIFIKFYINTLAYLVDESTCRTNPSQSKDRLTNSTIHTYIVTFERGHIGNFFEAIVTKTSTFHMRQDNRLSETGMFEFQHLGFHNTFVHLLKPPKVLGATGGIWKTHHPSNLVKGTQRAG
jgi:hypothetical protein